MNLEDLNKVRESVKKLESDVASQITYNIPYSEKTMVPAALSVSDWQRLFSFIRYSDILKTAYPLDSENANCYDKATLERREAMKRDIDLSLAILKEIEDRGDPGLNSLSIEGHSLKEINYHLGLLDNAGLIDAAHVNGLGVHLDWIIYGLTNNGHDFIGASTASKGEFWTRAKDKAIAQFGSLSSSTLNFILQLMLNEMSSRLGLS